jgi:hypothetical protein
MVTMVTNKTTKLLDARAVGQDTILEALKQVV